MPTKPPISDTDKPASGKPLDDEAARLAAAQADIPLPPELDDIDDDDDDDEDLVAFTASEAAGAFATLWRFTWPHLRQYKSWVAFVGIGLFIETLFNVIMPLSLKYLIDDALGEEDFQALYTILGVLAAAGIITSIVAIWYERWDARWRPPSSPMCARGCSSMSRTCRRPSSAAPSAARSCRDFPWTWPALNRRSSISPTARRCRFSN